MVLRPVRADDVGPLTAILAEPEVARWWGQYDAERVRTEFLAGSHTAAFAIEEEGDLVGCIVDQEEADPDDQYAGIDIFLKLDRQGEGLGSDAIRTLARHLFSDRGHHRLMIDPAVTNERALRCYERVGFRPVGICAGTRNAARGAGGTGCPWVS